MAGDLEAARLLDVLQGPLEPLVGERLDLAAVVADDVVVVLHRVADRLEAGHSVAKVDPLDEGLLGEDLEHAIHAREADRFSARPQLVVDLLGAGAAV